MKQSTRIIIIICMFFVASFAIQGAQSDAEFDRKSLIENLLEQAREQQMNSESELQNDQNDQFENIDQTEKIEQDDHLEKVQSPLRIVPSPEKTGETLIPHTFNFPNSPLEPIFEMFTELTGKMVLYSPDLTGTVNLISGSVELSRADAIEAITSSLALSGIILVPLGEKFVKAVPAEEAIAHAPKIIKVDEKALPDSGEFITRTVKLEQVKPSEVAEYLKPLTKTPDGIIPIDSSQTLLIHSDSVTMKQLLDVIKSIDVTPEFDYSLEVIPIRYSKVTDLFNTMSSLISGTPGATGSGLGAGGTGNFGNFGGGFGRNNQGRNAFGQGGSFGRSTGNFGNSFGNSFGGGYRPFQASRSSVSANQRNFQDRARQLLQRAAEEEEVELLSEARIVPDERSNSLLIFANKQDLTMITNMVSKVDHLLAQVLIEAIILEIGINDDLNLGVSLGQSKTGGKWKFGGNINNDASLLEGRNFFSGSENDNGESISNSMKGITSGPGFNYFGMFDDTLDIAVSAIASNSDAKIISRPRIQTSHAVPGFFVIGQQVPYIQGNTIGAVSNFSQSNVDFIPINITLQVIPYITPEGYIVMDINQNANHRLEDVQLSGNPFPQVSERSAAATLSVRDGDTIMLGGFIEQTKRKTRSGVPILKDIPLLGGLFRSKTDDSERTELIILLRATVLETPEEAALVARQERESIEGIKQMEEEFEAERRGRIQKKQGWKR